MVKSKPENVDPVNVKAVAVLVPVVAPITTLTQEFDPVADTRSACWLGQ